MLAAMSLAALTRDLGTALSGMRISSVELGLPLLVEQQTKEAERTFQGYAKATHNKEDAYAAARAFLRGVVLDGWQQDLIASAIAEPISEHDGETVLGHRRFANLLGAYEAEAGQGELWSLTWHGLLFSYFSFDPSSGAADAARKGWNELRAFLERTWPLVDRQAGYAFVPDWVGVLREESALLTTQPAEKYAGDYLRGDTAATDRLAADLGIPPSSWFWHSLVLGAVKKSVDADDAEFRRVVPQLIKLVKSKPGFRDEAIEHILVRYHACAGAPQDERLRDFVCQPTVWRNPKLKAAGIATAWNRVPEPVWRMVLSWVNEGNLKDFFDILAARNKADEGRLAFWSKYLKQISWTRLVFGSDTMMLKRTNPVIRDLIAREEGAYAELTEKPEVDAFMMQVGAYLIIEFSKKPNACYVYKSDELPFEPYAKRYEGGTEDLAAGFRQHCAARVVHREGWQDRTAEELRKLGIRPDTPEAQSASMSASESGAFASSARGASASTMRSAGNSGGPNLASLRTLVKRFRNAAVVDEREYKGGRLWVEDPLQRTQLGTELQSIGFKWSPVRTAWYYPEN